MSRDDGLITFGRKLKPAEPVSMEPDWLQSSQRWIGQALSKALSLPSGGWYVAAASRDIRRKPVRCRVDGVDYVVWRSGDGICVGPDECPHMGASLADGFVRDGCVVCPWHGLELSTSPHGSWKPVASFDDGVLVWIRPGPAVEGFEKPVLPERPNRFLDAVMIHRATCEPEDVIANRLDPWHGVHFHGHSFGRLEIIEQQEDNITARVVYRVLGRLGIEVDARFHCPEPRTICMTIVNGEGTGSVVETHATPIEPGRTAIIEATLATSDQPQFHRVMGMMSGLIRPLVRWRARKLWVEDAAYAERRYSLRHQVRA